MFSINALIAAFSKSIITVADLNLVLAFFSSFRTLLFTTTQRRCIKDHIQVILPDYAIQKELQRKQREKMLKFYYLDQQTLRTSQHSLFAFVHLLKKHPLNFQVIQLYVKSSFFVMFILTQLARSLLLAVETEDKMLTFRY